MKEGAVVLTALNPVVPKDVAQLFDARRQAILAGRLLPFAGPLKDSGGTVRKPTGAALSTDELASLNWYVEGVEGTVPK
jgi:simple sugar transport system substrate-binding protein